MTMQKLPLIKPRLELFWSLYFPSNLDNPLVLESLVRKSLMEFASQSMTRLLTHSTMMMSLRSIQLIIMSQWIPYWLKKYSNTTDSLRSWREILF
jgi:hypothetical protein